MRELKQKFGSSKQATFGQDENNINCNVKHNVKCLNKSNKKRKIYPLLIDKPIGFS